MASDRSTLTSTHATPYWDRETDQDMVCTDVRSETHDVKTFTFRAKEERYFSFLPGQYFSFDFEIDGSTVSRCYSVSTSALMPHSVSVTVKRVADGTVSNWLHDKLVPGTAVRAMGPSGSFHLEGAAKDKYLFITGGSGITPVMSMVRTLADARQYPDIVFFHAGRSPQDLVFADELRWRAKTTPNFRLFFLPESAALGDGHTGVTGRVSQALLSMVVPDIAQRKVMCCGPTPFMQAVRELSATLGVPAEAYCEENFSPPAADIPAMETPAQAGGAVFQLNLAKQDKCISIPSEANILNAMRQAGVSIPSSCGEGECGTCKTKLVSGKVHMEHAGGIRQREIDAGFFLPCCSTPLTDLVVDR